MVNHKHDIPVSVIEDPKEYHRLYRIKNKEQIKAYNSSRPRQIAQRERVRERKLMLLMHRGGECSMCGVKVTKENSEIFDFHHVGGKDLNLAPYTRNMELLKAEAEKCVVMCCCCHRITHRDK